LPSADIFRTGGYSNADVRTFCCKNQHQIFFQFIVCPYLTWTRGRSIFLDFV